MAQIIPFAPSSTGKFIFDVILDGLTYIATVSNVGNIAWIQLKNQSGNLVFSKPVTGSPDSFDIVITAGHGFKSQMIYRASAGAFEVDNTARVRTVPSNLIRP
jgi:hypothetical protein